MAKTKPIQRDEIIGALTLVIMFIAITVGRGAGNFYASYNEMKSLKVLFDVSEEELSSYLRGVMSGETPDMKVGLTITLPSVSNVQGKVTSTPDYVRRWLISVTLSAVVVRQPAVSDVQLELSVEGQHITFDTLKFEKEKVSYLGFVDRKIELKIDDIEGLRSIVEKSSKAHNGEVEIEVRGKVHAYLWFLDTWLPYSTVRYPMVEVPHLSYLTSEWKGFDGATLSSSDVGQGTMITVKFLNPTRVHTIRENITFAVYKDSQDNPVSVFIKEVPLAANSTGSYVFQFTPNEKGIFNYELTSGTEVLLNREESPSLTIQ
jgi:hypothetical protein